MNNMSFLFTVFCIVTLLTIICSVLFDIKKLLKNILIEIERKTTTMEKTTLFKCDNKEDIIEILENIQKNLESSLRPNITAESSISLVENSARNLKHVISLLKFNIKLEETNANKKVS